MANMSYCRFHNTLSDLRDCRAALEDLLDGAADYPLSKEELAKAKQLVDECQDIVNLIAVDRNQDEIDLSDRQISEALDEANAEAEDEVVDEEEEAAV